MNRFEEIIMAEKVIEIYQTYDSHSSIRDLALTRLLSFADRYRQGIELFSNYEGNKKRQEIRQAKIILEKICEKHMPLKIKD